MFRFRVEEKGKLKGTVTLYPCMMWWHRRRYDVVFFAVVVSYIYTWCGKNDKFQIFATFSTLAALFCAKKRRINQNCGRWGWLRGEKKPEKRRKRAEYGVPQHRRSVPYNENVTLRRETVIFCSSYWKKKPPLSLQCCIVLLWNDITTKFLPRGRTIGNSEIQFSSTSWDNIYGFFRTGGCDLAGDEGRG